MTSWWSSATSRRPCGGTTASGVPRGGRWEEVLNGDAPLYGGSGQGNLGGLAAAPVGWHGRPQSLNLTLPPLAMIALKVARR